MDNSQNSTLNNPPTSCPACNAAIYDDGDVNGLRVVQYACGRKQTKHPAKDYWMVYKTCPQAERVAIELRTQFTAQAQRVAELEKLLEREPEKLVNREGWECQPLPGEIAYKVWMPKPALEQWFDLTVAASRSASLTATATVARLTAALDNEGMALTYHILRTWDREKLERFCLHLLGDEAQTWWANRTAQPQAVHRTQAQGEGQVGE